MKEPVFVVTSLDVEEEGLFSGKYGRRDVSVENAAELRLLSPLTRDLGFPLTLFCAYAVFANPKAAETVRFMTECLGAEAGAHLHHWSTPPYSENPPEKPERTHTLDKALLGERLNSLLEKGREAMGRPLRSFRMGRWDLKAAILPMLFERGIRVDSSICPLRCFQNGPDHFLAPADPYWVELPGGGRILEAPITQLPIFPRLAKGWQKLACGNAAVTDLFHFFGAASVNPFWHGQRVMRLATRLHIARGGRVISLFWHSSEMMPGASPHVPDIRARDRVLRKIAAYLSWLARNFEVKPVTISQLAEVQGFPERMLAADRDW